MEYFFIGMVVGALIMAIAVAVSITYDPYAKITEYRLELGLDVEGEENEES